MDPDTVSSVSSKAENDEYVPRLLANDQLLNRTNTHTSELSRIITGIRDDMSQDVHQNPANAELVIAEELEKVSRKCTNTNEEIDYPKDRGYSWVIALMAMLCGFATWGSNAAFGVFLSYSKSGNSANSLSSTSTFPQASEMDYALIGGIVMFLASIMAPLVVLGFKVVGHFYIMPIGIVLQTAGYLLASFSTKTWQLYLTQGLLVGISFPMVFICSTLLIPEWFDKRVSTAMGICVAGAGLGGLFFSLVLNKVIQVSGDQRWALRVCAFVNLLCSTVAFLVMRPRKGRYLPLQTTLNKKFISETFKSVFNPKVFDLYPVMILLPWSSISILAYILMLYTTSAYSRSVGLSYAQASNATAVLNAMQMIGRPIMGAIGDRVGRNNLSGSYCLIIAILLWAYWINATTYGAIMGMVAILGLFIGVTSTMAQSMAYDIITDKSKLPAIWGGINVAMGPLSLSAEVIAISLKVPDSSTPYLHTQIFAGACFFFCFLLLLINREWLVRRKFKERRAAALESLEYNMKNDTLEERVNRYDNYLRNNIKSILIRTFYPIKV